MTQKILTISAGGILAEIVDAYQGTVTSVAALTLGTTGTDLSSTVATGTSTPVITLQVPTASATNRGALSSTDWSTFNGKQAALGFTAANDSAVVHNTGTETIAGAKTFSSSVTATTGGETFRAMISGTGAASTRYGSTGGNLYVGTDDSSGSYFGAPAGYMSVIYSPSNNLWIKTPATTFTGAVGFNGTTAIAKPTITGSRAGNAALASLLTALASYGLITDSTTA